MIGIQCENIQFTKSGKAIYNELIRETDFTKEEKVDMLASGNIDFDGRIIKK